MILGTKTETVNIYFKSGQWASFEVEDFDRLRNCIFMSSERYCDDRIVVDIKSIEAMYLLEE